MTDRILFLDIDGVFIPARAYYMANQTNSIVTIFDPCVVGMVNRICKETGCKLVIHSSWVRSNLQFLEYVEEDMDTHKWMIHQGLLPEYFHKDHTAKWRFSGNRWFAIEEWLMDHPEISEFVVLDDEPYCGENLDKSRIITTNFDEGLEIKDMFRIMEIFGEKRYFKSFFT